MQSIIDRVNVRIFFVSGAVCAVLFCAMFVAADENTEFAPKPKSRTEFLIEGFRVLIDDRLLTPDSEVGARAKKILEHRLYDIVLQLPLPAIDKLRTVKIYLDRSHGELKSAQYHPSRRWLIEHGYAAELARSVHIPFAEMFASPQTQRIQPWMVLHELAHAYHDQFIEGGFGNAAIKTAHTEALESECYASVLHIDGHRTKHYALTDPMEFFAEMSEAYWGRNDFYPFVRGELQEDAAAYKLIKAMWTP